LPKKHGETKIIIIKKLFIIYRKNYQLIYLEWVIGRKWKLNSFRYIIIIFIICLIGLNKIRYLKQDYFLSFSRIILLFNKPKNWIIIGNMIFQLKVTWKQQNNINRNRILWFNFQALVNQIRNKNLLLGKGSNISFNDFFLLLDGSNNLINFEIDIPIYVICVGRIRGVETKSLSY
jgi:hypothetical protein